MEALWLLSSFCGIYQRSFDADLLARECVPPLALTDLVRLAEGLGLVVAVDTVTAVQLGRATAPLAVQLAGVLSAPGTDDADAETGHPGAAAAAAPARPDWLIVLRVDGERALIAGVGDQAPRAASLESVTSRLTGHALRVTPKPGAAADPDAAAYTTARFGFRWFVPELLKHKHLWREVLLASLVLQVIALAFPLFTQTIIDKVVVHRTESTLIALAVGMAVFVVFTAVLTWVR